MVQRSLPTASSAFHRCRPRRRHHSVALAAAALVATVAIVAAAALFSRLKKCAGTPSGTEPCWELADGTCLEDIPISFLSENTDLTGTLKLGTAVKTIGRTAFYKTSLTGLPLECGLARVDRRPRLLHH